MTVLFFFTVLIGKEYETKYKLALQLLSSQHLSSQTHETEFSIVQSIKKLLGTKERYQDARKFDELYARLTASVSDNHQYHILLNIHFVFIFLSPSLKTEKLFWN